MRLSRAVFSVRAAVGAVVVALSPLLAACGSEPDASGSGAVRDSAGIRIVESTSPQWADGEGWRFADAPALDIGVFEGEPEYQLFGVSGAVRLSDGRVVVANAGTFELRYFSPDGVFERSTGSEGGGPGEFKRLVGVRRAAADTVITYDWSNRRVSVFSPGGDFARSFTVEANQGFAFLRDVLSDGTFIVSAQVFSPRSGDGLFRDTATWLRYSSEGALMDTIHRFPDNEMFMRASGDNVMVMGIPFGRSTQSAARGTHLLVGTGETFEIGEYDETGNLVGIIRRRVEPIPVTSADVDHYVQADVDASDDASKAEARRRWEDIPFPDTMMPYGSMQTDVVGNVWVEVYENAAARTMAMYDRGSYSARWHVFDPDGAWLGVVEAPAGFRPTDIGADYMLGTWRDELEIEHVQMYELIKS